MIDTVSSVYVIFDHDTNSLEVVYPPNDVKVSVSATDPSILVVTVSDAEKVVEVHAIRTLRLKMTRLWGGIPVIVRPVYVVPPNGPYDDYAKS